MGGHRRDIPAKNEGEVLKYDNSGELVLQLAAGFHNTLFDGCRLCGPRTKHFLDLGWILLDRGCVRLVHDLRDEESHPRTGE